MPQPCMFCGDVYNTEHLDCRRLRFAEAMALDPKEVEARYPQDFDRWQSLSIMQGCTVEFLRKCAFRRARPKRSRVQEMADKFHLSPEQNSYYCQGGLDSVRAVCEALKSEWDEPLDSSAAPRSAAEFVARHFLEPR